MIADESPRRKTAQLRDRFANSVLWCFKIYVPMFECFVGWICIANLFY